MVIKGIAMVLISSFAVKLLWNALIPVLFGGPLISFIQALGLFVLVRLLTGGIFRGAKRGMCGKKGEWREKMRAKMESMSPEEREKYKRGFRDAFKQGGGWDVNVFEVEEEEKKDTDGDENPDDKKDAGEGM